MRHFGVFAVLLSSVSISTLAGLGFAGPASADQILATSHVTAVTVYPEGAQVTRQVDFTAPVGASELLIADLPAETQADLMRVSADGIGLGAYALRTDRLPPRADAADDKLVVAKAAVETAEAGVRAAQAGVDAINAKVEAAEAQADFLRKVKPEGAAVTVDGVKALSVMIGAEVLAARQTALAAQAELPVAVKALEEAQKVLGDAVAAQDAALQRDQNYAALSVTVETTTAGMQHLTVTTFVGEASWAPVYDISLDRKAGKLDVARGVLVSQASGEDWQGVDLTLSTAQPSSKSEPYPLYPNLRRAVVPEPAESYGAPADKYSEAGVTEPVMEPEVVQSSTTAARMYYVGDTVVYHYPTAVDVATGVENLRLELDKLALSATVVALAVPRQDSEAYMLAKFTNDSPETLLPGTAFLHRDGMLVGSTTLEAVVPQAEAEMGFGAIEGIRLKREMPLRAEGDRGILSSSTQVEEKAVLEVENLTDESWPVRLLDQVPYSEQEELEISYTADPAPTEVDVNGQRGILAWEFELAAGEKKAVRLDHVISWPEGKELQ
ncbi:mucoidy inhibitor MuiA family protein [Cypionkella psychrotolerans]|uniref:mucoidy inhibitor MuiA family protein n=1 Tax=Cypionkella psychrotolerans TaxID=1678131 RepID=UPI0006B5F547|nr:mucoidy inhibitor MuiA family protein [Cypionkella psychrotolerans]